MKRRTSRLGLSIPALLLSTALAVSACGAQSTNSGSASGKSGQLSAVPGFDPSAKTITVGDIIALTGPISAGAKEQLAGQQAWYDQVNAKGGVAGKYKINMITADNKYDAQLAVQAYQQIKDKVVMLSGILGTPSVKALVPILNRDKAVAVPSNQAAELRDEPSLLPTFPSYQTNVLNAVSYLNKQDPSLAKAKYCALGYENEWGDAIKEGLTFATKQLGTTVTDVEHYAPLDTALTAQVQALKQAGCQVVAFGGAPSNTPAMVAAATQLDFHPQWITEFIANSTGFAGTPIADYLAKNVLFTGPGPTRTTNPSRGSRPCTSYRRHDHPAERLRLHPGHRRHRPAGAGRQGRGPERPGSRKATTQIDAIEFQGLNGDLVLGKPPTECCRRRRRSPSTTPTTPAASRPWQSRTRPRRATRSSDPRSAAAARSSRCLGTGKSGRSCFPGAAAGTGGTPGPAVTRHRPRTATIDVRAATKRWTRCRHISVPVRRWRRSR